MIERSPIIDKCIGCEKVLPNGSCNAYIYPVVKWKNGNCPLASHLQKRTQAKEFVDPLKQSKKQAAGIK